MNVLFEYLYRDAGNYKNWGEVIFSNTNQVEIACLEEDIRESIFDREFFVAEGLGIPILYFQNFDRDLDHGWHEFGVISPCDDKTTDSDNRDIQNFIRSLKTSSKV